MGVSCPPHQAGHTATALQFSGGSCSQGLRAPESSHSPAHLHSRSLDRGLLMALAEALFSTLNLYLCMPGPSTHPLHTLGPIKKGRSLLSRATQQQEHLSTAPLSPLIPLTLAQYHSLGKTGTLGSWQPVCLLLTLSQLVRKGLIVTFSLAVVLVNHLLPGLLAPSPTHPNNL